MSEDLYNLSAAAITACVLLHVVLTSLLLRVVPPASPSHAILFSRSNPLLTQGRSVWALKLRFALPWRPSPDLSQCGRSASFLLLASRATFTLAIAVAAATIALGSLALVA
jgi:hypothetical protein